jgi:phosphatidylglycerophosphate synthase
VNGLPDRSAYRARWTDLHGGAEVGDSRVTAAWLTLVEGAARPLARRNVPADALTALGVVLAGVAPPAAWAGGRWRLLSGGAVAASGFADGLDGSVAVLSGAETGWGFVLDSLADRAADALQLLAFRATGASARLTVVAGAGVMLLEYARARAAAAGFGEIGTITVGERPVRVAIAVTTLLSAGVLPNRARSFANAGAFATGALSIAGAVQFLRVAAPRLRERTGRPSGACR